MEKKKIKVLDFLSDPLCVTVEDGQKIFDLIQPEIANNVPLEVSFERIDLIISAFLNVAIGQLYGTFTEEKIGSLLSYSHLEEDDMELLRIVVANALRYYSNQENYDLAAQEVLEYA